MIITWGNNNNKINDRTWRRTKQKTKKGDWNYRKKKKEKKYISFITWN